MNLIIGGSGFVGSFLLKELQNFNTINLDKNSSPFYNKKTIIGGLPEIKVQGQGGLMDIELHPNYNDNGFKRLKEFY